MRYVKASSTSRSSNARLFCFAALVVKILLVWFIFGGTSKKSLAQEGRSVATIPPVITRAELVTLPPEVTPVIARISTDYGTIDFKLLPDAAPKFVANFIKLVQMQFYDNTTFYRYEPDFVLQGGAHLRKSAPFPPIKHEYKLPNFKYFVSTARTSNPDSATTEFSIQLADNSKWLGPGGSDPYGYTVFAEVVGGKETVGKFASLRTLDSGGLRMLDPAVEIRSIRLISGAN